jgi:hypothetical protein
MLAPKFGNLDRLSNRRALVREWLKSKYFRLSGLDERQIESDLLAHGRSDGEFLRIVMESMARLQGVNRWAENTPEHVLHLPEIKREIPDALIIHIIRDGRDAALSLDKQGWVKPFPWDTGKNLLVAGLYWQWLVSTGREFGRGRDDYLEVRFEDLNQDPASTLARIGHFIDHDLDYERIQRTGIGSVGEPNTSFASGAFNPVGRWRNGFTSQQLVDFESLVGDSLQDCGYSLGTPKHSLRHGLWLSAMKLSYNWYFRLRQWLKTHTPLGRWFVSIQSMYE